MTDNRAVELRHLERAIQRRRHDPGLQELVGYLDLKLEVVKDYLTVSSAEEVLRLQGQAFELNDLLRILTTDPTEVPENE